DLTRFCGRVDNEQKNTCGMDCHNFRNKGLKITTFFGAVAVNDKVRHSGSYYGCITRTLRNLELAIKFMFDIFQMYFGGVVRVGYRGHTRESSSAYRHARSAGLPL